MVLYLLLCLLSVLAGCGIMSLLGMEVDSDHKFFLSPVMALCSIAIVMGGLVAGGFTVGEITPALYTMCLGAAILGSVRHGKTVLANWRSVAVLAGLPLLILLPAIVQGIENYTGGGCMDGWAYVTDGQSLQHYPLGAEGWLPAAVQFSSQMGKATRFISFGFLALLAPLSGAHNDTEEVIGRYLGWLFFVYGSACLFFAKAVRLSRPLTWVFVVLAMLSGWTLKMINANSVDNTLALCFLPAVLAILVLMGGPSVRNGIALGVIVAAGLYAYPESSPFTLAALLAMAAQRMIAMPSQLREFRRMGAALALTIGVCISPYALQIIDFFRRQVTLARASAGARPGEFFYPLLLTPGHILMGYWGLGPDFGSDKYSGRYDMFGNVLAYLLTITAVFGLVVLLRRRQWSLPLFAVGMTALYTVFLMHARYPYAAYKVLNLSWFVIAYVVIFAAGEVWQALDGASRRMAYVTAGTGLGLAASVLFFFFLQERVFYKGLSFKSVREFKALSMIDNMARGQPVAMVVYETYANIWATHYLRDTKLYLADQVRGYMQKGAIARSEPVDPAEFRYVVTDSGRSFSPDRLLSKIGPYSIWDFGRRPWLLLTEVDDSSGIQLGEAACSLQMSKAGAELQILSRTATNAIVSAEFSGAGVRERDQERIRISVSRNDFSEDIMIGNGRSTLKVPLQPGMNSVRLQPIEKDAPAMRASQLLVSLQSDGPQIHDIDNLNGLERIEEDPFFWAGPYDTAVTVFSSTPGTAQLMATLMPGPSLVDKSMARLWISSPAGGKIEQDLDWGFAKITVPVVAGSNRVTIRAIGPTIPYPGDARTMMIGFRNLQASSGVEISEGKQPANRVKALPSISRMNVWNN